MDFFLPKPIQLEQLEQAIRAAYLSKIKQVTPPVTARQLSYNSNNDNGTNNVNNTPANTNQ